MSKRRPSRPEMREGDWGGPNQKPRRPVSWRPARPLVLIVVEGLQTEKRYFESLKKEARAAGVIVEVIDSGGDTAPAQLVQRANAVRAAKQAKDKWADDGQVWCVFDTEQPVPGAAVRSALEQARRLKIKPAVSNPAFEYWYILHFQATDSPCASGQEMKKWLRRYIPNYTEALDIYPRIRQATDLALENAARLRERANWETCPNPSTGVDTLVEVILGVVGAEV